MSRSNKPSLSRQIKRLPRDLKSKNPVRRKKAWGLFITILLVVAILLMGTYVAAWYLNRTRILSDSQRYQGMYTARQETHCTPSPAAAVSRSPKPVVWATSTPAIDKAAPSGEPAVWEATAHTSQAEPAETPSDENTAAVAETGAPVCETLLSTSLDPVFSPYPTFTPEPTPSPEPVLTPEPMETAQPDVTIEPLATANENTLVYALPTTPPVQSSFEELLSLNSDTIGFLTIDDIIALPVVQRENDNTFYLDHSFEQVESSEGTLFLDGANRLVPEDDCLIVYGHNMKNDTMFGRLESYANTAFLKKHAVVHFDTLYENRSYVPFAVFSASMDPNSSHYFDVRQFLLDETSFELFTLKMQNRSVCSIPVDVRWGDSLLLLVTCDYVNTSGRFILCLRQIRANESEDAVRALVQKTTAK